MLLKNILLSFLIISLLFSCSDDGQKKGKNNDKKDTDSSIISEKEVAKTTEDTSQNNQDLTDNQHTESKSAEENLEKKESRTESESESESTKDVNQSKDYIVTLKTSMGNIDLILYDETPIHKKNFLKIVNDGLYDGVIFHRVINAFMIQGGGIDMADKSGKYSSRKQLPAEFVKSKFHKKGALSAARLGDGANPERKSSWCQFYIVQGTKIQDTNSLLLDQQKINQYLGPFFQNPKNSFHRDSLTKFSQANKREQYQKYYDKVLSLIEKEKNVSLRKKDYPKERIKAYKTIGGTPHLDDQYTVFGEVLKGLDIVDKLAAVPTAAADKPVKDVKIISAKAKLLPKSKITKLYGYQFN